ncbi:MAG: thioredoxin domain-containing protein [Actinomycetota bacterium]
MANRLSGQTSPYLRQHQDNPVDWWPWSPQAFDEARARGVPVLLSVGYSACHWCHVMAHESFEDPAIAAVMNELFVNIKVDREERPDVDAVYMDATQAMTGHGGWPMTVFMTPEGEPFYCGTYFPPRDSRGMPGFERVLRGVGEAWATRREELTSVGTDIVRRLSTRVVRPASANVAAQTLDAAALDSGAGSLQKSYDAVRGGFGGAPKFPQPMALEFLLRHHARTGAAGPLEIVAGTCERMARGGIYDQLAGGFARYSVDAEWVVPHFEKMLYDNALLARVYAHLWRTSGSALAARIAVDTCDFLVEALGTAEGGFASALDADSEGVEGKFYAWTPEQLIDVLGPDDGSWAADFYTVERAGNFEHGASVLQRLAEPDDFERLSRVRAQLRAARAQRVPPGRDDKVVAAWNGLAIAALAETGRLFDRPDFVSAAVAAADLLVRLHLVEGRLRRVSLAGEVGEPAGVLEDYGDVAEGLLALYSATGDARWVGIAGDLLDVVLEHFPAGSGGFYDTADDAETLAFRPRDPSDNVTPAGSSAVAGAMLSYAALTGSARHRNTAEAALAVVAPIVSGHAQFSGWAAAVGEALLAGPAEVAVVGAASDTGPMERAARQSNSPGLVLAVGRPGEANGVPLLEGRPAVDGRATAYLCRHFVCAAPTTDPAELSAALRVWE